MKNVTIGLVILVTTCFASVDLILENGDWIAVSVTDEFTDEVDNKLFSTSIDESVDMLILSDCWVIMTWPSSFSSGQNVDFRVDDNEAFTVYCSVQDNTRKIYGFFDDDIIAQMLNGNEMIVRATFSGGISKTVLFSLSGITACYNAIH